MKNIAIIITVLLSLFLGHFTAQEYTKKGTVNLLWGWNKGIFSNSKIHFKGDNYNFTLHDVSAKDKFYNVRLDPHLTPGNLTLPQTNLRIGYFIKDDLELSFGVDHMKYVMENGQSVPIDGYINTGSVYDGVYNGEKIVLDPEFLLFEHTDGLNYGNIELTRFRRINQWLHIPENKYANLDGYIGAGAGLLVPRTNTTLLENERYDEFNVAGFGMSAKIGFNLELFRWMIFRYAWKLGYINMPNIRTTQFKSDKANQAFIFSENLFMFGVQHRF